ncbi:MAG TPA: VTT domain-containing protein [Bryobacteraceae bacterium]|nr:VTT domain-containing protein [Bryobacteraceae bacterium]
MDSVGVPMVSGVDALLIAVSTVSPQQAYLAAMFAVIGSLIGSMILYLIARKGGEVLLAGRTSNGRGRKLRHWFEQYGLVTIFLPAVSPVPLPMKIPVFCAGALKVRIVSFIAAIAVARVIRYFTLAYLGQRYGRYTLPLLKHHWLPIVFVVLALCVLAVVVLKVIDRETEPKSAVIVKATDSAQN